LLNELGTGATFRELSTKALASVNIPIPPLREQQQIVALLDEAFEAIDQAKANIEKNIQNAKELFQSKLIEIFTTNDKGWEHKRFQDIAIEFGRGKSKHRPRNDAKLFGGDYPFVQTGDVRNVEKFITKFSQTYNEVGLAQSKLWPKGTICITIAANIAETAILDIEACFPDSIIGLIVDDSKANRDYCFYALQYLKSELQAKGKGSAQDNINLGTFQTQFFPFPEIYTQEKMVKILDDLKDKCILIEDGYKMKLENLDDLKKSILQKAFAGELKLEKVNVA
ncbi:MAG: restriction endonuclease subunit S, partial [Fluviicola sp.]|nr:restriction endonuclease subunit S [Fluviicola sp.]